MVVYAAAAPRSLVEIYLYIFPRVERDEAATALTKPM